MGLRYNKRDKLHYHVRGKKAFPVTADKLFNFHVKGRCNIDEDLKQVTLILIALACYFLDFFSGPTINLNAMLDAV